jgi:hypothetical protein
LEILRLTVGQNNSDPRKMVACPLCTGNYKNGNSLRTHLSRAHDTNKRGPLPRESAAPGQKHDAAKEFVGRRRAAKKKIPTREKRLSVRQRRDLVVSIRVQRAHQLGYEAGVAEGLASSAVARNLRTAREKVTQQRIEVDTLRSHLESARKSAKTQATLMSSVTRERDELVQEHMCLVCMDQQRSIAVMPCNHIPLCYGCLLTMRDAARAKRIQCPMCQATIIGYVELSPGALPRAASA